MKSSPYWCVNVWNLALSGVWAIYFLKICRQEVKMYFVRVSLDWPVCDTCRISMEGLWYRYGEGEHTMSAVSTAGMSVSTWV